MSTDFKKDRIFILEALYAQDAKKCLLSDFLITFPKKKYQKATDFLLEKKYIKITQRFRGKSPKFVEITNDGIEYLESEFEREATVKKAKETSKKNPFYEHWIFKYIVAPLFVGIILLFMGVNYSTDTNEITNTAELKYEALQLSKNIIRFSNERQQGSPNVDFDNWQKFTNDLIKYNQESNGMYNEKFASEVSAIKTEFNKIGINSESLDKIYKFPTNYIGFDIIGVELGAMAYKLDE